MQLLLATVIEHPIDDRAESSLVFNHQQHVCHLVSRNATNSGDSAARGSCVPCRPPEQSTNIPDHSMISPP